MAQTHTPTYGRLSTYGAQECCQHSGRVYPIDKLRINSVKGRYDHIVFSRGADKHLEINQANAQDIADAIHEAIKDGARWWCLISNEL